MQGGTRRYNLLAISPEVPGVGVESFRRKGGGLIVERSLTAINSELIRQELISPEYR
jgi:hypothetical protein